MAGRLLLLFVLVPLLELVLLIKIGDALAARWNGDAALALMVGLVVTTGVLGTLLAKREGLAILNELQRQLAGGRVPGQQLLDGAIVLVCGALLITPGVLTDVFGFLGLFPPTRALMRRFVLQRLQAGLQKGTIRIYFRGQPLDNEDEPIDIG